MDRIEQKVEAIKTINGILEGRGLKPNNTIAEHIVDALSALGWRGPSELRWVKEMVFDQARINPGPNPYKKEETDV